jgi:hypothetical protein
MPYGPLPFGRCHMGPRAHAAHMPETHDRVLQQANPAPEILGLLTFGVLLYFVVVN